MSFKTADLCDDNLDKKIQVLPPIFKNYGGKKKFKGQVITIKLDKSNFLLLETLRDQQGEGKIIVVDNRDEFYGLVGDKLMTFAANNNWTAIIVNGYVRDTDETKKIDVGLFAKGTCPLRNFDKTEAYRGLMLDFSGVVIKEGDWIYADEDGLIISKEKLD